MGASLFSFRMVPVIAGMLALRRIDAHALVREAGLPADAVHGEVIAPLERIQRFVELAADRLHAPLFGLDLAERVPTGAFGLTEFLMRSAPSVETALALLCEFAPLINPMLEFRFVVQRGEAHYRFAIPGRRDALGAHLNEYTLQLVLHQFTAVLGERVRPERIWFAHRRASTRGLVERFGCPVEFAAADCGFTLTTAWLARKPPTADAALFEFLTAQARAQLANLASRDIISQVARVVEARLASGSVGGHDVAAAMATTLRSLQRHLADAGTSYREVLLHVRRRRRAELARAGLPETEIAHRLGFSKVSAMRRSLDATGR